jgi:hypothetical protein
MPRLMLMIPISIIDIVNTCRFITEEGIDECWHQETDCYGMRALQLTSLGWRDLSSTPLIPPIPPRGVRIPYESIRQLYCTSTYVFLPAL